MSYDPTTDLLGLLRRTSSGVRPASMPGLDFLLAALFRAGAIYLWTSPSAGPTTNQAVTVWLRTSATSWEAEGTVFLWNKKTGAYEAANPWLWSQLLTAAAVDSAENAAAANKVLQAADVGQLFTNRLTPIIQYTLPLAVAADGGSFEFLATQAGSLGILLNGSGGPNADTLFWGSNQTNISALALLQGSYLKIRSIGGVWFVVSAEGSWNLS